MPTTASSRCASTTSTLLLLFPGGLKMIDFGNMFFGQVTRGLSLSLNPKPIAKPYPQPEPNPKPQPKPEAHLTLSPTLTGATSHRQPPP